MLPDPPGHRTATGWSFVNRPSVLPAPLLAGFAVEVEVDRSGLRIDGRLVAPEQFARMVADRAWSRRLILLPTRSPAASRALDLLGETVADVVGRPVVIADGVAWAAADGILRVDGEFRRYHPQRGGGRRTDVLGAVLPVPLAPRTPPDRALAASEAEVTALDPAWAALLDGSRWIARAVATVPEPRSVAPPLPAPATELQLATVPPTLDAPVTVAPRAAAFAAAVRAEVPKAPESGTEWVESALWLPEADAEPAAAFADRAALRQELGDRYDAHARIVSRTLSENPGLRAVAGPGAGISAGLVAVRTYLLDERETVNATLRGERGADGAERVALLARNARYSLRRLPSVFGPVFRSLASEAGADVSYWPGEELVEPAFVDVDLAPSGADAAIEFAIWSASAHRLSGLEVDDDAALFPPGSRFRVLAVDQPDGDGPLRVMLRDLATGSGRRSRGAESTERLVARLRELSRPSATIRPPNPCMTFPIGIDARGRRYRRLAAPSGGNTSNHEGAHP